MSTLADACLRSDEPNEAVKWAEQTIALAPFRETGYRRLMEAHIAAGNRAEALQVYERCRRLLADELGAYPSPETDAIYRGLLEAPSAHNGPAAAPADVEQRTGHPRERRFRPGTTVAVATLAVTVGVGVVAAFLASRSGGTHATALAADAVGLITAHGD